MTPPIELQAIIFLGLAAYRIARFITLEEGPWDFMFRIRRWVDPEQDSHAIRCPHCVGFWSAIFVLALFFVSIPLPEFWWPTTIILLVFAVSGAASLIFDVTAYARG